MHKTFAAYDVWTDGSYREAQKRGGAGWVIGHDEKTTHGKARLPDLSKEAHPHGSDYAELYAVARALHEIPDGAAVKLRMDCENVLNWLKDKKLKCRKQETAAALQNIFDQASGQAGRMASVEYIKVHDRSNANMQQAHKLSQEACHMEWKP